MTFSEWMQTYLQIYKRDLAPKTREGYDRLLGLMLPILGSCALASVSPDDLQMAINHVADVAGTRQAQLAYALLHASLARAVKSRHVLYNACDAIDKPKHQTQRGRAVSEADWRLLEPVIDGELSFALMARAGLRRGELLALRWCDVDLTARLIRVSGQLVRVGGLLNSKAPKSAAGQRCVPIEPKLLQILKRAYKLTPTARIEPCAPETLARRWRRAQLEAGIEQPYRLHDLRHTYATRMVAAGCDLKHLQYMIGHSSFQLTADTYTHIDANHALRELDRVAEFLH